MWILDNEYNPALLVFLAAFVALVVFVAWIKTGRKEVLYLLGMVIVLDVGLVMYERFTISDREAIQATLLRVARELETNDRAAVYAAIHPKAVDQRMQAEAELPKYTFSECRITKIHETKVEGNQSPKKATVEFNIIASGSFRSGADVLGETKIPRFIRLSLEQDTDGQWKVTDYYHASPEQAIMQQTGNSDFPKP
ncbi:hypothetical protein ETAA8_07590 [Anatilimnocola aggregata]|uniref:Uncharacterized protein n=1 Tax=Anatilimnocola aggregata TaxID=2528021 RepID=A0A517Y623_9BACT|nr:hypothetical protein [Anatilimnocola aggregata]QDU25689.1 hypothetical protein ETAA8_07590 [Anatilimnocola aggregata]